MPERSAVVLHEGSTTYAGPDAVDLFRAGLCERALELYAKTGMKMTRGAGPKALIANASRYLPRGKRYPATREGAGAAAEAVGAWREAMLCAMPIVDSTGEGKRDAEGQGVDGRGGPGDPAGEGGRRDVAGSGR